MKVVRRIIPAAARAVAKRRLARWKVDRAVRALRNGTFSPAELHAFRVAWGNEGFAADERFLVETVRLLHESTGDVLECGTGATTIIAGILGEHYGFNVYSLEQDAAWSSVVKRAIARGKLDRVRIVDAPLRKFDDHMWYDIDTEILPRHFGLVLCDGPFIPASFEEPFHSMWRYGVLSYFERSRSTFGTLLLDDVNDARASGVLSRWAHEFGVTHDVIRATDGDCGVIRRRSQS